MLLADGRSFLIHAEAGQWQVSLRYTFRGDEPRIGLRVEVEPPREGVRILRNLHLDTRVVTSGQTGWRLQAPGSRVRPDLPLEQFGKRLEVSPASGLKGSAGLVALENLEQHQTFVWWPFSRAEIGDETVVPGPDGPVLAWQTDLSGEPEPGGSLETGELFLDLQPQTWSQLLPDLRRWLSEGIGVRGPNDTPSWIRSARIFEVQIGFSVFHGDWRYEPYPEAADLLADLDRIQGLGFTTIQIMPRHPFPSYNVFDYADVTTSWGDEDILRELVRQCHQRGMRVILDILLHGVVDKEAVAHAADGVRNGPYFARLDEKTPPLWQDDGESYLVAYSRHIVDFEPYWSGGSAARHQLADEHPEWFCRDSAGEIIGVYTKAFDNAHPGWQQYFIDSAVALVERLDIDGYRFDAPTYNYFANWSERSRTHAGTSMLGCLVLFRHLRRALKAVKPDVMLYTEPSGVLLREDMDVNYNYDEQWLFAAVMNADQSVDNQEVRNGRELGQWLANRDALLPAGSITAHHIDSHDTFWWPLPGGKWMREQFGVGATRALTGVFALSGDPFMMFVGGEQGIEQDLVTIARLRDERPELAGGVSDYTSVTVDNDAVYAVTRRSGTDATLVLVNLSTDSLTVTCRIPTTLVSAGGQDLELRDLYVAETLTAAGGDAAATLAVDLAPLQVRAIALT
nr:alpha-amylase family glycosyl hydrolase [Microlunatus panaciterrae]